MADQLPVDIAEAIEAFEACLEGTARGYAAGDHATVRAALDAVILKHLRGDARTSDVIALLTFDGTDCFHPAGFETECQCIGCPRKSADLGRSALEDEGREM